jgi:hypothetical protein
MQARFVETQLKQVELCAGLRESIAEETLTHPIRHA